MAQSTNINNGPSGSGSDSKESTHKRRRFIVSALQSQSRISLKAIQRVFPDAKRSSIEFDVDKMNEIGLPYILENGYITNPSTLHTTDPFDRMENEAMEKQMVGALLTSLIMGFSDSWEERAISPKGAEGERGQFNSSTVRLWDMYSEQYPFYSKDEILNMLVRLSKAPKQSKGTLRTKLRALWGERARIVTLDSGTTNFITAKILSETPIPTWGSSLTFLTVCTNCRNIFNLLGDPSVPIRTIVIGGQQRQPSSAIAGALAESFVRHCDLLNFGVTILGATEVDVRKGLCLSHTQEESIIKGLMLAKSSLRVLAVDNTKLRFDSPGKSYAFCQLNNENLDLIITNKPIPDALKIGKKNNASTREWNRSAVQQFEACVTELESRNIPVLVADFPESKVAFKADSDIFWEKLRQKKKSLPQGKASSA